MRIQKAVELDMLVAPTRDAELQNVKFCRIAGVTQFETKMPVSLDTSIKLSQLATTACAKFAAEKSKRLTARQREVFNLAMQGLMTKEIARVLNLSYRTVETHRAHILRRLGYSAFFELMREMLASNQR